MIHFLKNKKQQIYIYIYKLFFIINLITNLHFKGKNTDMKKQSTTLASIELSKISACKSSRFHIMHTKNNEQKNNE